MNSQVAFPKTAADVTAPATGIVMHPAYASAVARLAYVWGWPMVNMLNRKAAITQAPHPGRLNGVLPAAPRGQICMLFDYIDPGQNFIACPNQDVVYGLGFFSLDEEPVVMQVPDFGDRFWVYALYDARTDQFADSKSVLGETNEAVRNYDLNRVVDDSFVKNAAERGVDKQ